MLVAFSITLIAVWILYQAVNYSPRWIKIGKLNFRRTILFNHQRYYIEQVNFKNYQQALSKYILIIQQIENHSPILEFKADYLDWTTAILRFERYTIYLTRQIDKVYLIKSEKPISIIDFEQDLKEITKQLNKKTE